MGIFSGILLVSDIDGTLKDYDGTIPAANIEAIKYFIKNGGLFTVATGRGVESARASMQKIVSNCAPIVFNGGAIYDYGTEEFLWQKPLPDTAKEVVLEISEKFPTMGIQVYHEHELYLLADSAVCQRMVTYEGLKYTYERFGDIKGITWNKVLCLTDEPTVMEMIAYLSHKTPDGFYFCRTQAEYYEIMSVGADKGSALARLAALKGIDIQNTYAIGDYYNDETLISAAGYSCYTDNAPEELKPLANYISVHCKDGAVADYIRHIESRIKEKEAI